MILLHIVLIKLPLKLQSTFNRLVQLQARLRRAADARRGRGQERRDRLHVLRHVPAGQQHHVGEQVGLHTRQRRSDQHPVVLHHELARHRPLPFRLA